MVSSVLAPEDSQPRRSALEVARENIVYPAGIPSALDESRWERRRQQRERSEEESLGTSQFIAAATPADGGHAAASMSMTAHRLSPSPVRSRSPPIQSSYITQQQNKEREHRGQRTHSPAQDRYGYLVDAPTSQMLVAPLPAATSRQTATPHGSTRPVRNAEAAIAAPVPISREDYGTLVRAVANAPVPATPSQPAGPLFGAEAAAAAAAASNPGGYKTARMQQWAARMKHLLD